MHSTHQRAPAQQAVAFHDELTADIHPETIYEGDTSSGKGSSADICGGQSLTAKSAPSATMAFDGKPAATVAAAASTAQTPAGLNHAPRVDHAIQRASVQVGDRCNPAQCRWSYVSRGLVVYCWLGLQVQHAI
jgi:hypothetical protein